MFRLKKSLQVLPLALVLSLVGCDNAKQQDTKTQTSKEVATEQTAQAKPNKELPTYTVAMNLNYMPFEFISEKGDITGFDVDLLKVVAEKAGFTVQIDPYSFSKIIEDVKNGKEDMSASSIFISEDRKKDIAFSDPYFTMPMYIVGIEKEGRPHSINEITNQKIAIDGHFLLKKIMKDTFIPKDNTMVETDDSFLAFQKMYNGEADLMLENLMSIADHNKLAKDKKLFYIRLPEKNSIQLGYITQKGNQELLDKLNKGIKLAKADGSYDKVYNKWFGDIDKLIKERNK